MMRDPIDGSSTNEFDQQLKAIQDTFHSLSYALEREPTWEEFSRALDRLQAGEEKVVEATLTFYEWVESFIVESETHRTNRQGAETPRSDTSPNTRTVLLQLKRFATTQLGRAMRFEDWDETLVNRYKTFRANQGCKVSTIGKDLAVNQGVAEEGPSPQTARQPFLPGTVFRPAQTPRVEGPPVPGGPRYPRKGHAALRRAQWP